MRSPRFQNDDGGFGRALEPDFRLPASSAIATAVGFQYLREAGVASPRSHGGCRRALDPGRV